MGRGRSRIEGSPGWRGAAALVVTLLAAAACHTSKRCSCELTEGAGTVSATAEGRGELPAVRKQAIRDACTGLCAKKGEPGEACIARCAVDAETGKIGARIRCGE